MPSSTVNEADQNTQTAYILNLAQDENRPDFWPWDVSIFALFRWRLLNPSVNHRLVLNVQVDYGWPTGSHTITTDSLELKLTPGSASWYGRTNPDAHYYNFYQTSTPYGTGYHIDTIGSNDYSYHMLGWSKLTDDTPEDYKVGADGKIRVKGYFRQCDTLFSNDQPGRRLLNIYVMYSEDINNIIKTVQVLDHTDGTNWKYKGVVISGLTPGKSVKVGIGRPDSWYADWNLVAEWVGIEIGEGAGSSPLTPSTPSGPTSVYRNIWYTYSTSTTDPDGDRVRYEVEVTGPGINVSAIGEWHESGETDTWGVLWETIEPLGAYQMRVRAQDIYELWSSWSPSLTITAVNRAPNTPSTPSGTTSGYTGTSYTYSTSTTDPDGDNVCYQFDWGDGSNTTTGSYASGSIASASHAWGSSGTYYVKVRAQDSYSAWSGWSSTLTVTISSGGGGCPYISAWNGTLYVLDNNVLPASEKNARTLNGTDVKDSYRLEQTPVRDAGKYWLLLSEFEHEHSYIDQVKLKAVDHSSDIQVAVTPEGEILTYKNPVAPVSAIDNYGNNRSSEISLIDGNVSDPTTYFYGQPGDSLTLNFGQVGSDIAKLIMRVDMLKEKECIDVQVLNNDGNWQTVDTVLPRDYWSTVGVNLSSYVVEGRDLMVRLLWKEPHRLDFVGLDTTPQATTSIKSGVLVSATHSVKGDVTSSLRYSDDNYAELLPGEGIELGFILPRQTMEARDYIIMFEGHYFTITG